MGGGSDQESRVFLGAEELSFLQSRVPFFLVLIVFGSSTVYGEFFE